MYKAFTLIEFLVVIALVTLILALSFPFGSELLQEQRIEEETSSLVNNLKTAQARAMAGKYDSAWGVKFDKPKEGNYTLFPLFEADSFDDPARDINYDEIFQLPFGIETEGATEIVFDKLTGSINESTSTDVQMGDKSRTIEIGQEGTISVVRE